MRKNSKIGLVYNDTLVPVTKVPFGTFGDRSKWDILVIFGDRSKWDTFVTFWDRLLYDNVARIIHGILDKTERQERKEKH